MIDGRFSHSGSMMVDLALSTFLRAPVPALGAGLAAQAAAGQPIVSWAIRSSMMDRLPSSRSQASPTVS